MDEKECITINIEFNIRRDPDYGILFIESKSTIKGNWEKFPYDKGFQVNLLDTVQELINIGLKKIRSINITEVSKDEVK